MNTVKVPVRLHNIINLESFPLFCIYLLMTSFSGYWQKWTKPLNLKPLLVLHNFICCVGSFYTFYGFTRGVYKSGFLYSKEVTEELTFVFWVYYMTKIVELMDTVFMILRHRQRQISFLHVFHHSSMLLLSNFGYAYLPYPCIAVFQSLNSLVHVVLYFYYGLTAVVPNNPPQWRKQLTQMQIIQFLIDFAISLYGVVYYEFCFFSLFYGLSMTVLFSNFYYHAYVRKPKQKQPEDKIKSN
ncbi:very long chain fatty acid elongase 5-like [Haliotis asinina]|uniref:very long chain fatty acid elongase 5-like n=1 Tax=Haliotis asinina TaxID=109174 RepID=UPI0035318436